MSTQSLLTYSDVIEHLVDFTAGLSLGVNQSQMRRMVQSAYQEMLGAHDWPYHTAPMRLQLKAAEDTGTVSYDHATLTVTLTGATFPSWAQGASIYVDDRLCDIETCVSGSTTAVLTAQMNPGEDLTDEEFVLFRRAYDLPADFEDIDTPISDDLVAAERREMSDILKMHVWQHQTGTIRYYAIGPSALNTGLLALYPWPAPDTDMSLDATYMRFIRRLRYSGWDTADKAGTVALVAGSTTATGTSTTFLSGHAGSILRVSRNTSLPGSDQSTNPYLEEHKVLSVDTGAQTLTLQEGAEVSNATADYRLTDPVDLDPSCYQAFLHCCEKHVAIARKRELKDIGEWLKNYERALANAKERNTRSKGRRFVGGRQVSPPRLADLGTISIEDW